VEGRRLAPPPPCITPRSATGNICRKSVTVACFASNHCGFEFDIAHNQSICHLLAGQENDV